MGRVGGLLAIQVPVPVPVRVGVGVVELHSKAGDLSSGYSEPKPCGKVWAMTFVGEKRKRPTDQDIGGTGLKKLLEFFGLDIYLANRAGIAD